MVVTYTAMTEEIHRSLLGGKHLGSRVTCRKFLCNAAACSSNVVLAWGKNNCNEYDKKCSE
jgi:hypothetical protein